MNTFVQSIGNWINALPVLTFNVSAFTGDDGTAWQGQWSTFFWGSWISWAPLVGVFIARISRGRTVREFVTGVLVVPALVSFFWFAVFGGAAIHREMFGGGGLVGPDGVQAESALFDLLETLPLSTLTSIVAIVLIAAFLITSVNSGAFVLAVPFSLVMVLIAVSTAKAFYAEAEAMTHAQQAAAHKEMTEHISAQVDAAMTDGARLPGVPTTHLDITAPLRRPIRPRRGEPR